MEEHELVKFWRETAHHFDCFAYSFQNMLKTFATMNQKLNQHGIKRRDLE